MPRSYANYLSYIGGQPYLGRLRVMRPAPGGSQYPQVPLVDFTRFGQFVNSVETRTEGTIRAQQSHEANFSCNGVMSGDNGWWIQFWDRDFVPQIDSFGFEIPTFGRDMLGSAAHGPGNLDRNFFQSIWGWGTPSTS